jgi:hypothetical protein
MHTEEIDFSIVVPSL